MHFAITCFIKLVLCFRQACESALKEKHYAFQMEGFLDEAGTTHMKQLEALERVFEKAAEADTESEVSTCFSFTSIHLFLVSLKKKNLRYVVGRWLKFQVPDYLCCRISLDIFRDPVITPSGGTYERSVILDHLEKVMFGLNIYCIH